MRHQSRVLLVADDDARYALGACIGVEGVRLLFHILPLAGSCPLRYGFAEERHEFANAGAGEAGVGGEVAFGAELDCRFFFILQDLGVALVWETRCREWTVDDGSHADVEELHGCGGWESEDSNVVVEMFGGLWFIGSFRCLIGSLPARMLPLPECGQPSMMKGRDSPVPAFSVWGRRREHKSPRHSHSHLDPSFPKIGTEIVPH